MSDMVSVRIPAGLKEALEAYAQEHHYLDVSEAVRAFLRKKMATDASDPGLAEIKRLRSSIELTLKESALRKSRETLVQELRKIDRDLKRGF